MKEYFLKLSEILRIYFERRFQILAIESTTFEITQALKTQGLDQALLQKIEEFLKSTDLVKFAKWLPEPAAIIGLNLKAKQIVEDCTPREAPHGI